MVGRRCERFHFFDSDDKALCDVLLNPCEENRKWLEKHYLGFSVVYPVRPKVLGRTVLDPQVAVESGEYCFTGGSGEYRVNMAGYPLTARGLPFMEQDGRVAACASCALWAAMASLSRRFDRLPIPCPATITRLAKQFTLPERQAVTDPGLTLEEMRLVLNRCGYDPWVLRPSPQVDETIAVIGAYTASRIPVVLALRLTHSDGEACDQWHAVTVSGCIYGSCTPRPRRRPEEHVRSTEWIREFLVHDDQGGPFQRLHLHPPSPGSEQPRFVIESRSGRGATTQGRLWGVLVPLPQKVYLYDPEVVEERALAILLTTLLPPSMRGNLGNMVLHTYLVPTNTLKSRMTTDAEPGRALSRELLCAVRGNISHRWAWVTEFGDVRAWRESGITQAETFAEVLLDSTSTEPGDTVFVAAHRQGCVVRMSWRERDSGQYSPTDKIDLANDPAKHRLLWPEVTLSPEEDEATDCTADVLADCTDI